MLLLGRNIGYQPCLTLASKPVVQAGVPVAGALLVRCLPSIPSKTSTDASSSGQQFYHRIYAIIPMHFVESSALCF